MKIAAALVAATLAGAAHGQVFQIVVHTEPDTLWNGTVPYYAQGTTIEYSLWLLDGDQFPDFMGWSSFAGRIHAPGTHNLPIENPTDNTTAGAWEGRRPPSTTGFPGGSAGGFRYSAQGYTAIPDVLEGTGGLAFEGIAASVPLGGFMQDSSPDLEVFRGSFVNDVESILWLDFVAVDTAYFSGNYSNTVFGVQSQMTNLPTLWPPAPASAAVLGLGLLAVRRRR